MIVNRVVPEPWHLGDKVLVEFDVEVFWITFVEVCIFFVNFVFEVRQPIVERIHIVFDARQTAVKRIVHLFTLELGLLLLLCGPQWRACYSGGAGFAGV